MAAKPYQRHRRRGPKLSAEQARQGEIILRTPLRRVVFIGGLLLAAIVGLVLLLYQAAAL